MDAVYADSCIGAALCKKLRRVNSEGKALLERDDSMPGEGVLDTDAVETETARPLLVKGTNGP